MLSFWSSGAELIAIFGGNYGADPTVNLWLGLSIPAIFTYPIFIQFLNFKGQARSGSMILLFAAICNVALDSAAIYFATPTLVIAVSCAINWLVLALLLYSSISHGIFDVTSNASKGS